MALQPVGRERGRAARVRHRDPLPASLDPLEVDSSDRLYQIAFYTRTVGDAGKILLVVGLALTVIGAIFVVGSRLGLGHLPGDISVTSGNFSFFFPVVTCLVVSIVLTIVINVILRLWQ